MREGWCEIKLAQCVNNITKFYEIKTTMLQLYYKFIKFILQAINSVVFNTKML